MILLVEPDVVQARVIRQYLESNGQEVTVRRTAQTALDAIDQHVIDLAILEPQIGLHNGVEFLYELRSYPEWDKTKVILHTSNPAVQADEFQQAFKLLGVEDILYKPQTKLADLLRRVNTLLKAA